MISLEYYLTLKLFLMSTSELILIIVAFIALGFSIYRRYIKKDSGKKGTQHNISSGSISRDDDYEPYSKDRKSD